MSRPKLPPDVAAQVGAQGTHSRGKLCDDDEGDLGMAIGSDPVNRKVLVDFGGPVSWFALDPEDAVRLAGMLLSQAMHANNRKPLNMELPASLQFIQYPTEPNA